MTTELQLKLEMVSGLIHFIRGTQVILDYDLARL